MKRFIRLGSKGDTIVEVMIVLAVLSLAFSISSATANTSLQKARNAQEHSEALSYIKSQIELVRKAINNNVTLPASGPFCMDSSGSLVTGFNGSFSSTSATPLAAASPTTTPVAPYPTACFQSPYYYLSVEYVSTPQNYYDFVVRWDGVGNLGRQKEEIAYRIEALTPAINSPAAEAGCGPSCAAAFDFGGFNDDPTPGWYGPPHSATNFYNRSPYAQANPGDVAGCVWTFKAQPGGSGTVNQPNYTGACNFNDATPTFNFPGTGTYLVSLTINTKSGQAVPPYTQLIQIPSPYYACTQDPAHPECKYYPKGDPNKFGP